MPEDELTKMELRLIDKIVGALGMRSFQKLLWGKVEQAFRFTFRNTQVNYGFTHATPDPLALKYLEERTFILSDKTQDRLTGNLRWELLEGIRNTESISEIKKRLDKVFVGMRDYEIERIARTETLNAMNAGRLEAYEASEVTHYKMWRAAINNKRTAADSKRLHGQIQELGDPFVDPKTGDAVMHPPNRPNCRCAMIPLRKLPENVVRKGGQMYAADEMVGKIEIDIESLIKSEKRIWIKPTAKRKGHYRKIKGAKKVEEPKKSAIDRLRSIIPNVYLEGATESQLESITNGVEETIGEFTDVKIDSIGWSTPDDRYQYGPVDAAYIPKTKSGDPPRIFFNKDAVLNSASWIDKIDRKFNIRKDVNIEYFTDMILMHDKFKDLGRSAEFKERLKSMEACSRLFVVQSSPDKVKGLVCHECYHAIDVQLKSEKIFFEQLEKMGVTEYDKMQVSDYAASDDRELWAEAGAAMNFGLKMPDSIRKAFDATMEAIR